MMAFIKRAKSLVWPSPEADAIKAMYDGNPQPLIDLMNSPQTIAFNWDGCRNYWSDSGRITVCDDIYGPEVKIDGGELLDCTPSFYGLSDATGKALYNAILTNIKGWNGYIKKHNTKLA